MIYEEHLSTVCQWFEQWDESGQTLALIQLLTKVSATQARFMNIALENSLAGCSELPLREQEANNPDYINNLLYESRDKAMEELLLHLPLLRPGNKEAKHSYLAVMPVLLNYCVESSQQIDIAMEILVYIIVHPALKEEYKTFEHWRYKLAEKMLNVGGAAATPYVAGPAVGVHCKIRRSSSLTPPVAVNPYNKPWNSQEDLLAVRRPSIQQFSPSQYEAAPVSPQSSVASSGSGSETQVFDFRSAFQNPGMKNVECWLKSLRLHKYSWFFSHLTYTQMLNLTEETFEMKLQSMGVGSVTTGAQCKILLSIKRLRERFQSLCQLEEEITDSSSENLRWAIDKINAVLSTPLKAYDEADQLDNLPHQIVQVMYKVCTLLLVCGVVDDEALTSFVNMLDTALRMDVFTPDQKSRMDSWRKQILRHLTDVTHMQQQYGLDNFLPPKFLQPVIDPHQILPLEPKGGLRVHPKTHPQRFLTKRRSLQDNSLELFVEVEQADHSSVQRTHSAPLPPNTDPELNSSPSLPPHH